MRDYAKVSPKFWINPQGRQIKKLGIESQLIAFYLMTNPHSNMLGVYYLPTAIIAHETGLSVHTVLKVIQQLSEINFCSYDNDLEYVWVHDMVLDQIGSQLKLNDNRVKAVQDLYEALPDLSFLSDFYDKYSSIFFFSNTQKLTSSLEAPCKPLRSQEKEQEQDQEKEQEKKKGLFMSGEPDVHTLFDNFDCVNQETFMHDKKQPLKAQALEILHFLNEKTGRIYRPVEANLKLIIARLQTGASVQDCFQVIAKKTREWKRDAKMAEYIRPATLFNATKFEQYLGELVLPEEKEDERT